MGCIVCKTGTTNAKEIQPVKAKARKAYYYVAAAALVLTVAAAFFLRRSSPDDGSPSKEWEQLTFFRDSVVYPALSSDGRMLAFIRGDNSPSSQLEMSTLSCCQVASRSSSPTT